MAFKTKSSNNSTANSYSNTYKETSSARRGNTGVNAKDVIDRVLHTLTFIFTLPTRFLLFLINPPGSAILFGALALYFWLVSIESYYQTLPGSAEIAFVPKSLIEDGGEFSNLWGVIGTGNFVAAFLLASAVQAVQTWSLREKSIELQKAEYEAVAGCRVPDGDERELDLATHRRNRFKKAGMKTVRKIGIAVIACYLVDIFFASQNFPWFGLGGASATAINIGWCILSIFGAELFSAFFLSAMDEYKATPKVEVVNDKN